MASDVVEETRRQLKEYEEKTQITSVTTKDSGTVTIDNSNPILASELVDTTENVQWVIEGFLAKGFITQFSGLWKVGKTTLIAYLIKCLREGEPFLEQETENANILLVTEEHPAIWKEKIKEFEIPQNFHIWCQPSSHRLSMPEWVKLIHKLKNYCAQNSIDVLIIDPITSFWPVVQENDNGLIISALLPLNEIKKQNIATMLIHHFRKGDGEDFTASRGGGAFSGYVDIILEYRVLKSREKEEDVPKTQRELIGGGRFRGIPSGMIIDFQYPEFVVLGTRHDVVEKLKNDKVLDEIRNNTNSTVTELIESWDNDKHGKPPTDATLRRRIKKLVDKCQVLETGEKTVGKTSATTYRAVDARSDDLSLITNVTTKELLSGDDRSVIATSDNKPSASTTETPFTAETDPHRKAGGRSYWKLHVPADQRPAWVKEIYGLD